MRIENYSNHQTSGNNTPPKNYSQNLDNKETMDLENNETSRNHPASNDNESSSRRLFTTAKESEFGVDLLDTVDQVFQKNALLSALPVKKSAIAAAKPENRDSRDAPVRPRKPQNVIPLNVPRDKNGIPMKTNMGCLGHPLKGSH